MGINPLFAAVAICSLAGILMLLWLGRPGFVLGGGKGRIPKVFNVLAATEQDLPLDARGPLHYLTARLQQLGFEPSPGPFVMHRFNSRGHRLFVVPFVHVAESSYFLMGIEAGAMLKSPLVVHILSPLKEGRRVETTTLTGLSSLPKPPGNDVRFVSGADTIDEIWAQHRRALTGYTREERQPTHESQWVADVADSYAAWIQAALRTQRLRLDKTGACYRVEPRPRTVV